MKTCSKCGAEKPLSEFYKRKDSKDGYRGDCRQCNDMKSKTWRKLNPDKRKIIYRRGELKRLYGLTFEEYNSLLESQGFKCAMCGGNNPDGSSLCVDHDHSSGLVRELLCKNCNVALGNLRDDPQLCIKAAEYLSRHKEK